MSLYEALDNYLQNKKDTIKEYSYYGLVQRVKRIKDTFADLKLEEITDEEIQDYLDDWQKKYSENTIKSRLTIIKAVLKENGFLVNVEIKKNRVPKGYNIYNNEECEKIINYFLNQQTIKPNRLPIIIALFTGMRVGEILALQWLDVDLDRCLIDVSKDVVNCFGKNIVQTPKTMSSYRTIPIPPQLKEILLKAQPKSEYWDFYVTSGKDKPSCYRCITRTAEKMLDKLGIQWKGMHAFRHSYATRMLENGVNAKVVADLLGHSTINTTINIYSHTTNDFKKKCVNDVFRGEEYEQVKTEKETLYKQIEEMKKTMADLLEKISNM